MNDAVAIALISAGVLAGAWLLSAVFPTAVTKGLVRIARALSGLRVRRQIVDGFEWTWLDSDPTNAKRQPVVLLVHGYAADKDTWLGYSRELSRQYRVVVPDLPGFGDSDLQAFTDYSPRLQAVRLGQFCDGIGLGSVHVTGSSMGGYIACWFALDNGQRVSSLTLMNSAGISGPGASVVQQRAESGRNPLNATTMTELRAILDLLAYKPSWLPGFMRRHLLGVYRARGAHLDTVFWQLVNAQRADRIDQLVRNIAVPTLVVWGDHDQVIDPSCASEFSERIPASTLLLLERVGHIPMFEAPAATGAAHRKLLERAEEARRLPVIAATEPASQ